MNMDRIIAVRSKKTVYRDGDRCLKVFNEDYSKADVLNEALNQARVEETGLSIPKVLEVTVTDGKWTIVSEYIKGKNMAQLMEEHPESREKYLNQFVDLQLLVQSKNCPMLNKLKDKMSRKIAQAELTPSVRYELNTRLESAPKRQKLCHGDFNPSNILIAQDGTPYIIDWAHATQGNASADAARTYLLFWLDGQIDMAEKYLTLFCKKSGISKENIQKWMPIVAASQSVKGNEKEREFLHSWIDVVDYQ
ncbi:MAG: aminoglycoside phosphotransferase [Ruminococcaceae bacterium]|nr:aminoglycoside phosphotransferase [Oscillospiraceae bacterium]